MDNCQLKHSAKYKKLIRDIRKHHVVQATGRCFQIHGYLRDGLTLHDKPCQILFRKVAKNDPQGILYSKDHTRVDITHDFQDWDHIFNTHRICDDGYGYGSVAEKEFLCQQLVKGYDPKTLCNSTPVFVSSWSVFEMFLIDGKGVFVEKWDIPTKYTQ